MISERDQLQLFENVFSVCFLQVEHPLTKKQDRSSFGCFSKIIVKALFQLPADQPLLICIVLLKDAKENRMITKFCIAITLSLLSRVFRDFAK